MKTDRILSILALVVAICGLAYTMKINKSLHLAKTKLKKLEKLSEQAFHAGDSQFDETEESYPAPKFALVNKKGDTISLDKLSNEKQKVLVFSAEDCPYCIEYYPEVEKFAKEYNNIEVLVIQEGGTVESLQKDHGSKTYEALLGDENVFTEYQIESTPTTFLLGKDNTILRMSNITTKSELESFVFQATNS